MFFFKNKRSFLIIEILLGIFLLGIFLAGYIATPKVAHLKAIESLFSLKAHHLADEAWIQVLNDLKEGELPLKQQAVIKLALRPSPLLLSSKVCLLVEKSAEFSLVEIKYQQKDPLYLLYECHIHLETKIGKKIVSFNFPYRFIVKK